MARARAREVGRIKAEDRDEDDAEEEDDVEAEMMPPMPPPPSSHPAGGLGAILRDQLYKNRSSRKIDSQRLF